jgi:hypothetical protein
MSFIVKFCVKVNQFHVFQTLVHIGFVYRRTDGWTDRRPDMVKPAYPPTTSLRGE